VSLLITGWISPHLPGHAGAYARILPVCDDRTVLAIAHRTPAGAPEVVALSTAGVNVFEVDLRLIGAELVSTHFRPLVKAFPKLQQDNGRFRWGLRDPRAPSFTTLQDVLPADAELLLDLKDDRGTAALHLAEAIVAQVPDPTRFHACSKHWDSLRPLQEAGFRTWRTLDDRERLAAFDRVGLDGAHGATVRRTLVHDPRTRDRLLDATGGRLTAWTVNDVAEAERLLRGGLAGLTSDRVEVHRLVAGWRP
jgi:hypothetical protein